MVSGVEGCAGSRAPTAHTSFDEAAATLESAFLLREGSGLETILQREPSQCSVKVSSDPSYPFEVPTAQMSLAESAEILVN